MTPISANRPPESSKDSLVVSNVSDASFALDVAFNFGQKTDISDLISLRNFPNTEFCPRFMGDEKNLETIGQGLAGKTIYLLSNSSPHYSRNELAFRNLLIASAAKENGAKRVVLVEPDLFFSAQDRGPHFSQHPQMATPQDRKKFDGQPFTAKLYARLLRQAGVDQVVTVHNHKPKVLEAIYREVYQGSGEAFPLLNLDIAHIVANYIRKTVSMEKNGANLGFVAPDQGAETFVNRVREFTGLTDSIQVTLEKKRSGPRHVELSLPQGAQALKGRSVFILDDMVRTGSTIGQTVRLLAEDGNIAPAEIFFYCTHTYISEEGRENLNSPFLTEFITTNTLPNVLNRDDQGRLRKKIVVLKIAHWIADALENCLEGGENPAERYGQEAVAFADRLYLQDYSSRNTRHALRAQDQLSLPLRNA
ncbi:MAG: phosphoribosyltransferase family protein [Deltaproteobacteria bacterium]|nr:phosphoribosyltransferase family protein [Deltaproteobacteria bacterium]